MIILNKKVIAILGLVNIFAVTLIVYLGGQYLDSKKEINAKIDENTIKMQNYKKATKAMTLKKYDNKVSEDIAKKSINLRDIENGLTKDLTDGFTQAYNDTHTKGEFDNLENELYKKVGYLLASKILNLSAPTISQAGEIPGFDKLNSISISYSPYNIENNTIDILILVDYNIPANLVQSTDGNADSPNTNKKAKYTVTYNVKTREYSNLEYAELGGISNENQQ